MRLLLALALVGAVLAACGQPCVAPPPRRLTGNSPCVLANGGAFAPDSGFALKVFLDGPPVSTCLVNADTTSGRIALEFGTAAPASCDSSGAAAPREPPVYVATCSIPPLPAGQYTIDTQPQTVFTLPAGDAGIPTCP